MGQLVFQATLGGQVNLVGPNTASTFNINVPAVAGNMVTTGDTGTVSSTMLASSLSLTTPNINVATATTINGLTVGKGAGSVATNTAVGASALAANTTASGNTAIGYQAAYTTTTGAGLTAIGGQTLYNNTSGTDNVAVGGYRPGSVPSAMSSNTTGSSNVAVGGAALANNTTASNNTAVGYQAGYTGTTATANTLVGKGSGYSATTGSYNSFFGDSAGYYVTTGGRNTILGRYSGNQGGLNIATSSNYIVLSDGDGNPRGVFDSSGYFLAGALNTSNAHVFASGGSVRTFTVTNTGATPYGYYANYTAASPNNTGSEFLLCNDSTTTRISLRSNGGIGNYSANNVNLSDSREKTNANPAGDYLAKICAIPVRTYNYIDQNLEEDDGLTLGVYAQDVQAVAPELVTESNWGTEETPKMRLSIYQTDMQYALMKCIQELKAEFDAYKASHP